MLGWGMFEKLTYIAVAILFAETIIGMFLSNMFLSRVRDRFPEHEPPIPSLSTIVSGFFYFKNKQYRSIESKNLVQLGHVLRFMYLFHLYWGLMCVFLVLYPIVSA